MARVGYVQETWFLVSRATMSNESPYATEHCQDGTCNEGPRPCTISSQQREGEKDRPPNTTTYSRVPGAEWGFSAFRNIKFAIPTVAHDDRFHSSHGSGQVKPLKLWFAFAPARYNRFVPQVSPREGFMDRICASVFRPRRSLPGRSFFNTARINDHKVTGGNEGTMRKPLTASNSLLNTLRRS